MADDVTHVQCGDLKVPNKSVLHIVENKGI